MDVVSAIKAYHLVLNDSERWKHIIIHLATSIVSWLSSFLFENSFQVAVLKKLYTSLTFTPPDH